MKKEITWIVIVLIVVVAILAFVGLTQNKANLSPNELAQNRMSSLRAAVDEGYLTQEEVDFVVRGYGETYSTSLWSDDEMDHRAEVLRRCGSQLEACNQGCSDIEDYWEQRECERQCRVDYRQCVEDGLGEENPSSSSGSSQNALQR